jgi:hypothetical protein
VIIESLFTFTLFWSGFGNSSVLKCGETPSTNEAYYSADAVFVGKVIKVIRLEDRRSGDKKRLPPMFPIDRVQLKVETAYRGIKDNEVEVETIPVDREYGISFKMGKTYLVYAHRKGDQKNILKVRGCGRTDLITIIKKDLKILDELSRSKE